MRLNDWFKKKALEWLGLDKLANNPHSERLRYVNDEDAIKTEKIRCNRVWYAADGDELLNYYTNQTTFGFAANPVYNRNKRNYFWGLSASECNIKRVHSGVPKAIVDTLTNVVGYPKVTSIVAQSVVDKVLKANNFEFKLMQQARPLTLVEGWGAWKPVFNKDLSDVPLLEYYAAENVEFVVRCGVLIAIMYKSYYKKSEKNYLLVETRRIQNGDSIIESDLFAFNAQNEISPTSFDELPELANVVREPQVIEGYNKVLGVPSRYFYDTFNPDYGKSVYDGKIDLFDDLDQSLSQRSQTSRVSTPVEYYDVDLLERDKFGNAILPSKYNRQYVAKNGGVDADGNARSAGIQTTQPQLNFAQYNEEQKAILDMILTGILSPATMGIDVAKKDNADAQREKEKVTIMTRNNIISQESLELRNLFEVALDLQQYMNKGTIDPIDYDISVRYDEFANPSFENELNLLSKAWVQGAISTKRYVDLLWGDKLSDEEKEQEIEWLDASQSFEKDLFEQTNAPGFAR